MRMTRVVGAATAAYGIAVAARPEWLARPSGLVEPDGRVAQATATSLRPLVWRDAASGTAMLLSPAGSALTTATALRIAADVGDAVLLGKTLPPAKRGKAVAVSLGWAALSVIGLARDLAQDVKAGRAAREARPRGMRAWARARARA